MRTPPGCFLYSTRWMRQLVAPQSIENRVVWDDLGICTRLLVTGMAAAFGCDDGFFAPGHAKMAQIDYSADFEWCDWTVLASFTKLDN